MFINVGNPVTTTTTPVPLLGDVVFVYLAAKAASVKSSKIYPTVYSEVSAPTVSISTIHPTVHTGVEI